MAKKVAAFIFSIKLSVFILMLRTKLSFIRRDSAEFLKYGLTEEKISELEALIEAFAVIPSDEELLGNQGIATEAKDATSQKLKSALTTMMNRVTNRYGNNSARYRKFKVTSISNLEDSELSKSVARVIRVLKEFQADLLQEGLTPAILQDFEALAASFDRALITQEDAIADRDIASEDRAEKANVLYRHIVKHCETGKLIWRDTNEAKYNDYIIYDTPSGEPEEEAKPAQGQA